MSIESGFAPSLNMSESPASGLHSRCWAWVNKRPSSTLADEGLGGRDEDISVIGDPYAFCPIFTAFFSLSAPGRLKGTKASRTAIYGLYDGVFQVQRSV